MSIVGVSQNRRFELDVAAAHFRSLSLRVRLYSVQAERPALLPLVRVGRPDPRDPLSHRMELSGGPDA